jgi:metal-responsive CopG/Arc/MetJ family transcriptional regulator
LRKRGKVAVTIPARLLEEVERLRKRFGGSRSAVFERALVEYVAGELRAASARRYVAGYRRYPEQRTEVRAALAAAMTGLAAEQWDAAG